MKIDKRLNLVIPVETESGTLYVHSSPLMTQTFEAYYLVLARAFSEIYRGGLGWQTGPRVAMMIIRDVAKGMNPAGTTGFSDDVELGLIGEMKRLTNVAVLGPAGWANIPYTEATAKGLITQEDASEVENAVAFFIVASSLNKRSEVPTIVTSAAKLWGGLTTSLNCTEYAASLPTSTEAANTGATAAA